MLLTLLSSLPMLLGAPAPVQVQATANAPARATRETSALVLDGSTLSAPDYEAWLLRRYGEDEAPFYCVQLALELEAARLGLVVDPLALGIRLDQEIDQRIQGAHAGRKEAWIAELAAGGRSEQGYRVQRSLELRADMLSAVIARASRVITKELVQREFERRYGTSGRYLRVQLLRVDPKFPPPTAGASGEEIIAERKRIVQETRKRVDLYRLQIQNGESFAEIAKQHSDDVATREQGGVMDEPLLLEAWPQNFVMAVMFLQPGALSQVVRHDNSFYLAKVLESKSIEMEREREPLIQALRDAPADAQEISAVRERLAGDLVPELLPALWARATGNAALDPAEVVMRFRDVPVTRRSFGSWLRARLGEARARDYATEFAVQRAAELQGLSFERAQIEARVDAEMARVLREDFGGRSDRLELEVRQRYRDESHWKRDLVAQYESLLPVERMLLAARVIREDDVRAAWEERYGPNGRGLVVRWIYLQLAPAPLQDPPPPPEQALAEAEQRRKALHDAANQIVTRARAGERFEDLARAQSDDAPTREFGGRIAGHVVPERYLGDKRAALAALQVGGVTDPLPDRGGYAIYQLEALGNVAFESVAAELRRELTERLPDRNEIASELRRLGAAVKLEFGPGLLR
jgi:parvulin-like peptidyl-prolyl isomerase